MRIVVFGLGAILTGLTPAPAQPPDADLGRQAFAVLDEFCSKCHHGDQLKVKGFQILDHNLLITKKGKKGIPYVVVGQPEASLLWQRISPDIEGDMPEAGEPEPTDEQRDLIRRWIAAGAPAPTAPAEAEPARTTITAAKLLASIRDDLRGLTPEDRRFRRYLTVANLHNLPSTRLKAADLRIARAATSKALNHLSLMPEIHVPSAVDPDGVLLAIDLRAVGWDRRDLWRRLLADYPYALRHDKVEDEPVRALAKEVKDLAGTPVPMIRADWFVTQATRPPLYHDLLEIPANAFGFRKRMGVDAEADFKAGRLARGAVRQSGVSKANRAMDHFEDQPERSLWESYDFLRSDERGNLARYPLGPDFSDHEFPNQTFRHAGGELIASLPNGLQQYLLVDAGGQRIDSGPPDVVEDKPRTSGTALVVNGISCMGCHERGMVRFETTIHDDHFNALGGAVRAKAVALYNSQQELDALLDRDERRFLAAMAKAVGPFLQVGPDKERPLVSFDEPIGQVAKRYYADLGLEAVAAELGLADHAALVAALKRDDMLDELGLNALADGGGVKRQEWDSLEGRAHSIFQETAAALDVGIPFRTIISPEQ